MSTPPRMSALRITTLIAGVCALLALTLAFALEGVAKADLVPEPIVMLLRIGTVIIWMAHFAAFVRDTVIAHIDKTAASAVQIVVPNTNRALGVVLDALQAAVTEAEQRGATEARIDTLAKYGPVPTVDPVRPTGHRLGVVDN